jgi:hypothetical protein
VAGVGAPATGMAGGTTDAGGPAADAVVRVLGCTGTLVAPDIVLTSGHCLAEADRGTLDPPHPPAQKLDRCPDNWQHAGRWYPLLRQTQVAFGRDRLNPVTTRRTQRYAMVPCADMVLLQLDAAVPRAVARPIPVLANLGDSPGTLDADKLAGQSFVAVGWGQDGTGAIPRFRQRSVATYAGRDAEKIRASFPSGTSIQPGDSGGPLLWTSPSGVRYVVAIVQQSGNPAVYLPMFRGPVLDFPAVSSVFPKAAPETLYCPAAHLRQRGTVPLGSWWSPGRADNAVTASRWFSGCHSAVRGPDYGFFRHEGNLFDPTKPKPKGTKPLYTWFSPSRGDNYTTTAHGKIGKREGRLGPDYRFVRLEGYVAKKSRTVKDARPLYTWFSPSRGDNYTTTAHGKIGKREGPLGPDYRFVRLEGYVPSP